MTFLGESDVRALFDGLQIVSLDEEDQDGDSFSGPKHWHVFDIVARSTRQGIAWRWPAGPP